MPGTVPTLTLAGAKDAEDADMLLHDQESLRNRVFLASGVVFPLMTYDPAPKTTDGRWEVRMDGEVVSSGGRDELVEGMLPQRVVYGVFARGVEFITPVAVAYHMNVLAEACPDLVRTVRAVLSLDQLTGRLRAQRMARQTIRDLRGTLEEILVSVADEARPQPPGPARQLS